MRLQEIVVPNVDMKLLRGQRDDLYNLMQMEGIPKPQSDSLEGLASLLDFICDKYTKMPKEKK